MTDKKIRLGIIGLGAEGGMYANFIEQGIASVLRSHDLQYDPTAPVHARLLGSSYQGSHQIYTLELADGTTVQATMPAGLQHVAGEMIGVRLQQDRELVVFAG